MRQKFHFLYFFWGGQWHARGQLPPLPYLATPLSTHIETLCIERRPIDYLHIAMLLSYQIGAAVRIRNITIEVLLLLWQLIAKMELW